MKKGWLFFHACLIKWFVGLLRIYQKLLSPLLPSACRFYPTCSEYAIQALIKYGLCKGLCKTGVRILKCNPFFPGGYDPV
jgi:uncharacterized protein